MARTSNWTKFKWPYEKMENFTRHEPFQKDTKATYIDGMKKRKKSGRTLGSQALEALQKRRAAHA